MLFMMRKDVTQHCTRMSVAKHFLSLRPALSERIQIPPAFNKQSIKES